MPQASPFNPHFLTLVMSICLGRQPSPKSSEGNAHLWKLILIPKGEETRLWTTIWIPDAWKKQVESQLSKEKFNRCWGEKKNHQQPGIGVGEECRALPFTPQEAKDRPFLHASKTGTFGLDTFFLLLSGVKRGTKKERKKNTHEYFMLCLCWLLSSLNTH